MLKQNIINGFLKTTFTKDRALGRRILDNDLVDFINVAIENDIVSISSNVVSENLFNTYTSRFKMDFNNYSVIETKCTCIDFEKSKKTNYCCKHINAVFLKFLEDVNNNKEFNKYKGNNTNKFSTNHILNYLIQTDNKTPLKIEILLNKDKWSKKIKCEFKIGLNSSKSSNLYTIKDINSFMINKYNEIPIKYGKDFTFDIKNQKFLSKDIELLRFVSLIQDIDINYSNFKKSQDRLIYGKELMIPNNLLKAFFKTIREHNVYLNDGFYSRKIETEIIEKDIPLPIDVYENENIYLQFSDGLPEELGNGTDVFIYRTNIYIPSQEQISLLKSYINIPLIDNKISFSLEDREVIYKKLIPKLSKLSKYLLLDKTITNNIINVKPSFSFFIDRVNEEISIKVNVIYDKYEFNIFSDIKDVIIYRDIENEKKVINILLNLNFYKKNNLFYFLGEEDDLYKFLKFDLLTLQKYGEVFYSNDFKGLKQISDDFNIEISTAREDYFELKIENSKISKGEFNYIIQSIIANKKYFKLNVGEIIDLEDVKLRNIVNIIRLINKKNKYDEILSVPNYFGYYVQDKFKEMNINYGGTDSFKKYNDVKINSNNLKLDDFNGVLRTYQEYGVKWLTEKYNLKLGGILGDEMGLGKTIQAIGLILNVKPKKTLIVAPTSLIYNWKDEFEKFSPTLNVCIITGTKANRRELLEDISDYDVIITTYNTLKLDIELYDEFQFDLCFLDEAQNIKNPKALNSKACKRIRANVKFAITGTPIENNLLDLWSIFDFILPGYLLKKENFNSKFNRNLNEDTFIKDELNKLIGPFLLRRLKKDVLLDLPPKIDKLIKVEMSKSQEKVYCAYNKMVIDLLSKEISLDMINSNNIQILSYITKLRQISIDPHICMADYNGTSGKLDALYDIFDNLLENNKKVLVFSQFTSVLKKIASFLNNREVGFSYIDGSISAKNRQELTTEFNNSNDINIFLISLKAGGTGLNLTGANVVVHLDPWWNPAVENQATDRAHRLGQTEPVEVIKIITKNTIEEKVLSLQDKKRELIQNIIGEEVLSTKLLSKLDYDEFVELFKI